MARWYILVLKTAAGGSTGVNRTRGRRLTIMKSSTGNGARRREIACISYFMMLTQANETLIYARTAEINCYYLMTLSVFALCSLNVLK